MVLGGRYVALELAQLFARLGTSVTVLQRSARLIPDQDEDVSNALTEALRNEVRAELSAEVATEIEERRGREGVPL